MDQIPPQNYAQTWADGTRTSLPKVGTEREILTAYLDHHRETFALKCAGIPRDKQSEKVIPPSDLTLHGLLRHLAGTERWWFAMQFAGQELPHLYYSDDDPDQDFESLDGDIDDVFDVWRAECQRSRDIVAATESLEATGTHLASGEQISLRRILVHMIVEYARHNGHADLLRERIDGATGF